MKWLLACVVALAALGRADAGFITGGVGFAPTGPTTFNGATVGESTAITVSPELFVNVPGTQDLSGLTLFTLGSVDNPTITEAGGNLFIFEEFNFLLSGGTFISTPGNPDTISYSGFGTLLAPGFDPTPFTLSLAVTRTGSGSAAVTNSSFVAASSGTGNPVPEPTGLALAGVGVGLFTLRWLRR